MRCLHPQPATHRHSRRLWLFTLTLCLWSMSEIFVHENLAHALEGQVWAAMGGSSLQPGKVYRQVGAGSQLGLNLSINERWGIQGGAELLWYNKNTEEEMDPLTMVNLSVGARYNLDYFKYIPFLSLSLVNFTTQPIPSGSPKTGLVTSRFGTRLGIGLLWRPRREWSLGGQLDLTGSVPDFGLNSTLWFQFNYHWRL